MTSGKGGAKQQVTLYYMSQHFGICVTADALRGITVNEKIAWEGRVTSQGNFGIDRSDLFGGPTKQGGVKGMVYFLPGAADQVLPDNLAQKLGRADGADCPGYRGLTSIFMTGPSDGQAGFYWTANDPYLPGVWIKVERAPVGLSTGYAMVPRPGASSTPVEAIAGSATLFGLHFSPDHQYLYAISSTFMVLDLRTRTMSAFVDFPGAEGIGPIPYALAPDAIYATSTTGDTVIKIGYDGSFTDLAPTMGTVGFTGGVYYVGGQIILLPGSFAGMYWGLFTGTAVATSTVNYFPNFAFNDVDGNGIAVGGDTHQLYVGPVLEDGDLIDTTAYGSSGGAYGFDNGTHLVIVQGTTRYLVTKTRPHTIITGIGGSATDSNYVTTFNAITPGSSAFWLGFSEYRSDDLSLIRTVDFTGWPSSGHVEGSSFFYDWYNNAFISGGFFDDPAVVWRLLDRGEADANPAHIIYECLTNTDWGMGSPSTLIDVTSFENAGVELFNEPLGLSMIWTKQATIQDFIQEVLDHIQATLFVDPQSGLLTLKLIRGDYDVDTLPTISPSTANLSNFGRKLWGDIVNEINVTWTNPDNEQDETVTAHDLASITTQGGIVSDSRNYYGVRYSDLAMRLAARDLRSAAAPLATCDVELDRSYWALRPASVIRVDWPQYGLDGVVMRVTSIDYGKPGDPTIKCSLIEDVFGLDVADYVAPPSTLWVNPSADPTAMTQQAALTLPYFLAAQGITTLTGAVYPEVLAGVLGASSNSDTFGYELWGEVTLTDGSTEWQVLASLNLVGYGELSANLAAEASSTGVAFTGFVGSVTPSRNALAIIGSGTEAQNELALITGASTTFTLSRGVLDTVPRAWASGTPVWFVTTDDLIEDPNPRAAGEVVSYRLRTRTSKGLLSLFAAPLLTTSLSDRPWLPQRPANVTIGSVQFNDVSTPVDMTARPNPWVTITWSNRNRLLEDAAILKWTDSTITPEAGQTTTVAVYAADGTVISTHTGITGTTYNVPDAGLGLGEKVLIVLTSSRTDADGTFESLQGHGIWVKVYNAAGSAEGLTGTATASFVSETRVGGSLSASGAASVSLVGAAGSSGTILVGNNAAQTSNLSATGNTQAGTASTAVASGTANNLNVRTSNATSYPTAVFRLCLWSAATATTGWTLLGYTADTTGLPANSLLTLPLLTPVSIVSGNLYALTIQCGVPDGVVGSSGGGTDYFVADTFSDGPVSSIATMTVNGGGTRIIYATT